MSKKNFHCPHARWVGDLVLCSQSCEETGAKEVWRARDSHEYIHEQWWCEHRCRWWAKEHSDAIQEAHS